MKIDNIKKALQGIGGGHPVTIELRRNSKVLKGGKHLEGRIETRSRFQMKACEYASLQGVKERLANGGVIQEDDRYSLVENLGKGFSISRNNASGKLHLSAAAQNNALASKKEFFLDGKKVEIEEVQNFLDSSEKRSSSGSAFFRPLIDNIYAINGTPV